MRYVLRLSRVMLCNFGVVAEGSPPSLLPLPLIPPPLRPPLVDNDDIPPASMLDDDDLPTTVDAVEDEDEDEDEDAVEDGAEDEDEDEDPEDVLERPSSSPTTTTDIAVSPPNETSWLMGLCCCFKSNRIRFFF